MFKKLFNKKHLFDKEDRLEREVYFLKQLVLGCKDRVKKLEDEVKELKEKQEKEKEYMDWLHSEIQRLREDKK